MTYPLVLNLAAPGAPLRVHVVVTCRVWRLCSQQQPVEPSQFRSGAFTRTLKNNGLRGSMGRVAAAGDNARMESFHSLLQHNVLDSKKGESQEELRIPIVHWIEGTYHRRRRKRSSEKMTPVEYEVAAEAVEKELLVA